MNSDDFKLTEWLAIISDILQVINFFENKKQNTELEFIKTKIETLDNKLDLILEKLGGNNYEQN